jgi:hypothetical protein
MRLEFLENTSMGSSRKKTEERGYLRWMLLAQTVVTVLVDRDPNSMVLTDVRPGRSGIPFVMSACEKAFVEISG